MEDNLISILLVDDSNEEINLLQRAFRISNVANPLFTANDGMEALDKLRGRNDMEKISPTPKIILLDINMPRMNGHEFLKELRADKDLHSTSVFVLTSSNDEKDRMEAYNYHVAGYILKPITVENLVKALATLNMFWKLCYNDALTI
jgi:CheY-like chemotaxis protein